MLRRDTHEKKNEVKEARKMQSIFILKANLYKKVYRKIIIEIWAEPAAFYSTNQRFPHQVIINLKKNCFFILIEYPILQALYQTKVNGNS